MNKQGNQQALRNRVQRFAQRRSLAAAGRWIVQTVIMPIATSLLCYYMAAYLERWMR